MKSFDELLDLKKETASILCAWCTKIEAGKRVNGFEPSTFTLAT